MKKLFFLLVSACAAQQTRAQKLEPNEKDALLSVQVINQQKEAQAGEQVTFENVTTKQSFSGITTDAGKFDILVPKGEKYKIKYKAFTTDADYTVLDVPNKKGELVSFDVIIQVELPKKYTLNNVYFESGKATLDPKSFRELDDLIDYMKLRKVISIEIAGHTDNVGTADNNLMLSQDRANTVRDYLIKKGIDENRVIAKGYGDTQPLASNDSDAGKQKNRRTEVRLIKQ